MNKVRQRKLEARENRMESLKKTTSEKTKKIQVPQPKEMKNEKVIVEVKRGRGRPPKNVKDLQAKKTVKAKEKK